MNCNFKISTCERLDIKKHINNILDVINKNEDMNYKDYIIFSSSIYALKKHDERIKNNIVDMMVKNEKYI